MKQFNTTVKQFMDHFLPSNTKIKVVKSCEVIFDGTLDELYYYGENILDLIVSIVTAEGDKVCLSCRNR